MFAQDRFVQLAAAGATMNLTLEISTPFMLRYTLLRKALSTNGEVQYFGGRPFALSSLHSGRIEGDFLNH
jgi:hypothetical protein